MPEDLLHAAEDLGVAVGARDDPVDEIRSGKVELLFGEALGPVGQEVFGFGAQKVLYSAHVAVLGFRVLA